jgi:hypothetical protein
MVTLLALVACSAGPTGSGDAGLDTGTAADGDSGEDSGGETAGEPVDADGDGYPSDEDCDDADATVHPGVADACDGVDRNCDGAVVDEGGCGEVTEVDATFPVAFYREQTYASIDCTSTPGCVWTPSGGDVLVDHTGFTESGQGGFAVYRWTGETFDYALSLTTVDYEVYTHATVVGDFDGDGTADLAVHGGSVEGEYIGELALIPGDETRWPTGLTRIDDAAYAVWEGVEGGDQFSEELDAGDIDGDGLVDLVTHAPADAGDADGGKSGWLFVIPGRTAGFPTAGDTTAVQEEWYYPHSRAPVDGTPVDEAFTIEAVHPDLDGDGLADLIGHAPYGSYVVIPGANLVSLQGAYIEDLVETQSPEDARYPFFTPGSCKGLDLDDDGVEDCLFRGAVDGAWTIGVASGASLAAGADPFDAALTTAGPIEDGDAHAIRDLDGDGLPDVGFTLSADSGTQCVIASSRLPIGGTLAAEDIAPCWHHADDVSYLVDITSGDFDGTGVPDLVLSQRPYVSGASNAMFLLRDLALPWDDPTRW